VGINPHASTEPLRPSSPECAPLLRSLCELRRADGGCNRRNCCQRCGAPFAKPLRASREAFAVDEWTTAAGINGGAIFRRVSPLGKIWGDRITPKAIWHLVKAAAKRVGIKDLAPHDLRRTCAWLCHLAGGELEQIQFLLGHASVHTTERYLGCKQKISEAVNDNLGLEDP
jgi:integrase